MITGAVMFDPSRHIEAADGKLISLKDCWASVSGNAAFPIQSVHDLPSSVVWLTNLSYSDHYESGLYKNPNFKHSGWLRSTYYQIASELGIDPNHATPDISVPAMAGIAQRVITHSKNEFSVEVKSSKLVEDFATALSIPKSKISDRFYDCFEPVAEHPFVSTIKVQSYTSKMPGATVRRNRITHAKEVLNYAGLPDDKHWELVKKRSQPNFDKWIADLDKPFLVQCTVSDVKPKVAEILSWGSGAKNPRKWLTDTEYRAVQKYATVACSAVLVNQKPAQIPAITDLLPDENLAPLSFSMGLIAEQIWLALANKNVTYGKNRRFTAAAAWVRAADRMLMFEHAKKLHTEGIDVLGYGVGSIRVAYPKNGLKHVLEASTKHGLLPTAQDFMEANEEAS